MTRKLNLLLKSIYCGDFESPPSINDFMDLEESGTSQVPGVTATEASSCKCVLLVEDDRSVRRYLEVTLQRSGYKVITAEDGLEAMKVALSSKIDVVVTDAVMPNMGGQQLARFLRNHAKLAKIPIVLLTGQENKAAAEGDALVDAFLYKPVKVEVLKSCLAKLLS